MKKIASLAAVAICCGLFNCGPSDDPNPNPGGGGGGGDVTITSITPETLYADDEITINGTGFSTDPEKNLVQMGAPSGDFIIFQVSDPSDPDPDDPYFKVLSATATKLVVKVKNEVAQKSLNFQYYDDTPYRVRVTVNGKSTFGTIGHCKRLLNFSLSYSDAVNRVVGCNLYAQAGDSIHMSGSGFYGPCSVVIDGKAISPVKVKSITELRFLIPKNHFGEKNDDCYAPQVNVKVANSDGKFFQKDIYISQSPPMRVYSASFSKSEYSAGETPLLTITGYSIYSSATYHINNNIPNGWEEEGPVGAGGYPNEVEVQVGAHNGPGTYNVQLKYKTNGEYGFTVASFKWLN